MCHVENHTCVCDFESYRKVLLVRWVICPTPTFCGSREFVPMQMITRCADFHRHNHFSRRYDCVVCASSDTTLVIRSQDEDRTLDSNPMVQNILAGMDREQITEFHHLSKQNRSGRRYFLHNKIRDGDVDLSEEYSFEVYSTGNMFVDNGSDGFHPVPSDIPALRRGVRYEQDPSPRYRTIDGVIDEETEEIVGTCCEGEFDTIFDPANDPEGDPLPTNGVNGHDSSDTLECDSAYSDVSDIDL